MWNCLCRRETTGEAPLGRRDLVTGRFCAVTRGEDTLGVGLIVGFGVVLGSCTITAGVGSVMWLASVDNCILRYRNLKYEAQAPKPLIPIADIGTPIWFTIFFKIS
jgi:hypothetical protein